MKYVFILHVMNAVGGWSHFAIDYNLSATECADLLKEWIVTIDEYSAVSCETDNAPEN